LNTSFNDYNGDIFLYYGDIVRSGYKQLSTIYENKVEKNKKVCLILVTCGGDPDAAYRMARATNHHYEQFEILIPDICKSAGTLLCIGAHKLIFGDRGELGPLDIQLSKPDEMFESMSGLDIIQAINALENQLLQSFRSYLVDIRGGSRIKTKMAAEIATQLAASLIEPLAARIDPVTLGEHQRAMQIAYDYGLRLDEMVKSLKEDSLVDLVSSYPSHGFVIDRKEAATLFNNVSAPDELTCVIYEWARGILDHYAYPSEPIIIDVLDFLKNNSNIQQEADSENKIPDVEGAETKRQGINGKSDGPGKEDQQDDRGQKDGGSDVQHLKYAAEADQKPLANGESRKAPRKKESSLRSTIKNTSQK
jgi:hypothetical protein